MPKVLPLVLFALPLAAQQLEVIEAAYGAGNFQMNVTQKLRALIQDNVLDVSVDPAVLGGDPAPGTAKRLRITYRHAGVQYEASAGDFERIRIPAPSASPAPQPSPASTGGFSLGELWGTGGGALRIVAARYGEGTRFNDVRGRLQGMVSNDALSVKVDNASMGGDPAVARDKNLEVTYEYRGSTYQALVKEGATLKLPDPNARPVAAASPAPPSVPSALRIATARYGHQDRFIDVRDRLQSLVRGNSLSVKVDNAAMGSDPAVGKDKYLELTYEWNGYVYAVSAKEGRTVNLPDSGAKQLGAMAAAPAGRGPDSDAGRAAGNRGAGGGPTASPSAGREITPIGAPGGLRIFYARYGAQGQEIDVRERLRPLLQNNALNTTINTDSMGGDPAPAVAKSIRVIYEFRGRTFEKIVADGQTLALP